MYLFSMWISKKKISILFRKRFKTEFSNRINEIIIFHPLSRKILRNIVDIQLEKVQKRLLKKNIKLDISEKVKKYLVKKGYDPTYGARPLKRVIQNEILDEFALKIIEGKIKDGAKVKVDLEKKIIIK